MKVIVYPNLDGTMSMTIPTGEISLEEVQAKDTPAGSIVIDTSMLPQGADAQFFNAWELNGTTITVNLEKAKVYKLSVYNALAAEEGQKRQANTAAGIDNVPNDEVWKAKLNADRAAIAAAKSTTELLGI